MRSRLLHAQPLGGGHVNVTPMIDVLMCLIIFYLIVGQLATHAKSTIRPPVSGVGAPLTPGAPATIEILPDQTLRLNGEALTPDELAVRLRALAGNDLEVHLLADRELPYRAVAPALAICRELGLTSVRLITRPAQRGAP